MHHRKFSNYWTSTETYDALKTYMDMDFDGLRTDIVQMLGGGHIKVNRKGKWLIHRLLHKRQKIK